MNTTQVYCGNADDGFNHDAFLEEDWEMIIDTQTLRPSKSGGILPLQINFDSLIRFVLQEISDDCYDGEKLDDYLLVENDKMLGWKRYANITFHFDSKADLYSRLVQKRFEASYRLYTGYAQKHSLVEGVARHIGQLEGREDPPHLVVVTNCRITANMVADYTVQHRKYGMCAYPLSYSLLSDPRNRLKGYEGRQEWIDLSPRWGDLFMPNRDK